MGGLWPLEASVRPVHPNSPNAENEGPAQQEVVPSLPLLYSLHLFTHSRSPSSPTSRHTLALRRSLSRSLRRRYRLEDIDETPYIIQRGTARSQTVLRTPPARSPTLRSLRAHIYRASTFNGPATTHTSPGHAVDTRLRQTIEQLRLSQPVTGSSSSKASRLHTVEVLLRATPRPPIS